MVMIEGGVKKKNERNNSIKFNIFLEAEINQKLFNTKILWILMFQSWLF